MEFNLSIYKGKRRKEKQQPTGKCDGLARKRMEIEEIYRNPSGT